MLVVSRKKSQSVKLIRAGEVIATVMVTDIGGDRVRIGFAAPSSVSIVRSELDVEADFIGSASQRPPVAEASCNVPVPSLDEVSAAVTDIPIASFAA